MLCSTPAAFDAVFDSYERGRKMKKLLIGICAILAVVAALGGGLRAQSAKSLSVDVAGLQVIKKPAELDQSMSSFLGSEGTTLKLLVRTKGAAILEFNRNDSAVAAFTDNRGTDLKKGKEKPQNSGGFSMGMSQQEFGFPHISDDGTTLLMEVRGPNLPAAGSTKVSAKGHLTLSLGSNLTSARQKNLSLRKGSKVTVGPVPFQIENVKAGSGGGFGFSMGGSSQKKVVRTITLKANKDASAIQEINFYDSRGQKIETRNMGSSTMRGMGMVVVKRNIGLTKKLDRVTIEVKWWKDHKKTKLPFNVETGLGLE